MTPVNFLAQEGYTKKCWS